MNELIGVAWYIWPTVIWWHAGDGGSVGIVYGNLPAAHHTIMHKERKYAAVCHTHARSVTLASLSLFLMPSPSLSHSFYLPSLPPIHILSPPPTNCCSLLPVVDADAAVIFRGSSDCLMIEPVRLFRREPFMIDAADGNGAAGAVV